MALYTPQSRDRVRDAVDFVELVSARTELRRAGPARYEGLCPFHDERSPSFGIDPVQKVYYCFGCQASGDLFTFVEESEGVDFKGALELLAERSGIELEREQEDPQEAQRRQRRERLLSLLARTAVYYERVLWDAGEAKGARKYLLGRGLSEQALKDFGVGYSPSAWDKVLLASRRAGFSEQELLETGLAQRSREAGRSAYDRFRRRIMFPLADMRGRVLGFGAREIADASESGRRGPKYLNTSDNEIYHKGMHLYGSHLARAHAAKAGSVILCEGYTDVIALHQAGMPASVGLMGTALTESQVAELSRMAQVVLLALDADTAGQEAMLKAARLAAARKLELRVVQMPGGMDPAELIQREGAEAMQAAVQASVPFVRFRVLRELEGGDERSPEGRDKIIEALRPIFASMPQSALRLDLAQMVAGRLALPQSLLEGLLSGSAGAASGSGGRTSGRGSAGQGTAAARTGVSAGAAQVERAFLALCIGSPEAGGRALARLRPEEHFTDGALRRAAQHLSAGDLNAPLAGVDERDQELQRLLAELVVEAGREPAGEAMLEVSCLQLELSRLEREIQTARAQAEGEVTELAHRRVEMKRDLDVALERAMEQSGE
ncbi:MAG: DNA primase [Solirubrobacteraceae bacterium]